MLKKIAGYLPLVVIVVATAVYVNKMFGFIGALMVAAIMIVSRTHQTNVKPEKSPLYMSYIFLGAMGLFLFYVIFANAEFPGTWIYLKLILAMLMTICLVKIQDNDGHSWAYVEYVLVYFACFAEIAMGLGKVSLVYLSADILIWTMPVEALIAITTGLLLYVKSLFKNEELPIQS